MLAQHTTYSMLQLEATPMTTATRTAPQHAAGLSEPGIPVEVDEIQTSGKPAVRCLHV